MSDRVSILPRDLRAHRSFLNAVVPAHAGQDGAQRLVCLLGGSAEFCILLTVRILNILGFGKHGVCDQIKVFGVGTCFCTP